MLRPQTVASILLALLVAGDVLSPLRAEDLPSAQSQAAAKKIVAEWFDALTAAQGLAVNIDTKVEMAQDGAIEIRPVLGA